MQNSEIQSAKQRFGIIGNSPQLNHAIQVAVQVAPTDMTVLINGESGSGKESFSKIIHNLSQRKHGQFIAINCGAIPEGTIDSELFGHEKGSFTGAQEARKGYFEVTNGGTIFLDEIAEMPLGTQARLLRVLENGEFIRVGSSKVQKTDVRVVAATNINLYNAIEKGKFREDLYYRLNTVPIHVPALYKEKSMGEDFSERDLLYKILFDMKKDMNELKKLVLNLMQGNGYSNEIQDHKDLFHEVTDGVTDENNKTSYILAPKEKTEPIIISEKIEDIPHETEEESLSLEHQEKGMIMKALKKNKNKR